MLNLSSALMEGFFYKKSFKFRGCGTMCSVDCSSGPIRDKIVAAMRKEGVHLGVCGDVALR